jgi:hypothetical protein
LASGEVVKKVMSECTACGFACQLSRDRFILLITTKEIMAETVRQQAHNTRHVSVRDVNKTSHEYHIEQYVWDGNEAAAESREITDSILTTVTDIGRVLAGQTVIRNDVRARLERILHDVKQARGLLGNVKKT